MAYTLPELPYPENALEPHIDAQTMNIHRTKHHQAYINNVNTALEKHPNLASKPIDQLMRELSSVPEEIRTVVRNNGGGHGDFAGLTAAHERQLDGLARFLVRNRVGHLFGHD